MVVKNESHFEPLALHVNGIKPSQFTPPHSRQEAIEQANDYIKQGYSVDVGLMQINSNNFAAYGINVSQALDPCTNIRVGSTILYESY